MPKCGSRLVFLHTILLDPNLHHSLTAHLVAVCASVAVLSCCSPACMVRRAWDTYCRPLYRKKARRPLSCPGALFIGLLLMWEATFCGSLPKIQKVIHSSDTRYGSCLWNHSFLLGYFFKHMALLLLTGSHGALSFCFGFHGPEGDCLCLWGACHLPLGLSEWISHMPRGLHFKRDIPSKVSKLFSHVYLLQLKVRHIFLKWNLSTQTFKSYMFIVDLWIHLWYIVHFCDTNLV